MNRFLTGFAILALATTTAFARAKTTAEPGAFVKMAAAANAFEIQSSLLADRRGQSNEVKSFARRMISDHTNAREELRTKLRRADKQLPTQKLNAQQRHTLAKLRRLQGVQFDRAYVNSQLLAHKEAVALFRSYSTNGRPSALKDFAAKTLPALEEHLNMIQGIHAKIGAAG